MSAASSKSWALTFLARAARGVPAIAGQLSALLAAALFGLTAPVLKALAVPTSPLVTSAMLYLGAGVALIPLGRRGEAPLGRRDLPIVLAVIGLGGMLAPALLLVGLARASAFSTSLLLNLEAVFTTLFAVVLFRESIGRRGLVALALVVTGAAILTADRGAHGRSLFGPLAIAGACAAWGLDNNLTQRLAARDPVAVARTKGLAAGALSLLVGLLAGGAWPTWRDALSLAAVGALGVGASLVLFVRALRQLGAARTGMLFATAPFAGALAALFLDGDRPSWALGAGGAAMAGGVALLLRERHEHRHTHEASHHEHRHVHDQHHQHAHAGEEGPEPHAHPHRHDPVTHSHPHTPDLHHRHKH